MNDTTTEETDEEREARLARLRATRARKALQAAPDIALHVRAIATNGKIERGETLAEWTAPMRITATDDVDELFARLVEWVTSWSRVLVTLPTSVTMVAWSRMNGDEFEPLGMKAGTTPEGAAMLIRIQCMWLLTRDDVIAQHPSAAAYQNDILDFIWALRSKYPTAPRPERQVSPRPCPICREPSVGAEWFGPELEDVKVECAHCGHEIPLKTSSILKWLS